MNLHEIKAWTTDQLEEHFTNVSLWELAVREIARRERVGCAKIEAGSPGSSAVFLLDGKYVVKIFPPEHAGDADVEAEVLNALAQDAAIPAPRLHSKDTDPILQWPYLLMDCVSGVALRDLLPDLDDKELERLADEIGAVVHAMHQLGDKLEPALSRMGRGWSDTLTEMEADRSLALKALRNLAVHTPEKGWVEEVAVALESEWNACLADPGVLVHRDLTADHFYLSESSGRWRLSALIDFADAAVGPCELDWHDLRFWAFARRTSAMDAFLRSYYRRPVDERDLRRSFLVGLCVPNTDYGIRANLPPDQLRNIRTLSDLQEVLWPSAIRGAGER